MSTTRTLTVQKTEDGIVIEGQGGKFVVKAAELQSLINALTEIKARSKPRPTHLKLVKS